MSNDFGITSGHVEYSNIRFYSDTRHMVIFEAPKYRPEFDQFYYERPVYDPEAPHRTRLFLSDDGYKTIRRMELKGMLSILLMPMWWAGISLMIKDPSEEKTKNEKMRRKFYEHH